MNIMAGSLGGNIPEIRTDGLSVLSIVVNNICPLQCAHCYLQPEEPSIGLKSELWLRFLDSVFADLKPDTLCFSGKEVFADEKSAALLFEAVRLRNTIQCGVKKHTRVGVITNGTLIARYRDHLTSTPPDWLDVSIDGLEVGHDSIRGKGAFAKMARNLPWLLETLGERLWVTLTLMETNLDKLPEIVAGLNREFGLKRFSVGLFKPQAYTSPALRITENGMESRLMQSLRSLGTIGVTDDVQVRLELDSSCELIRQRLERELLIPKIGAFRTAESKLNNGILLRLQTTVVPVGLWRAARVTNEGQWLAAEDLVNARDYGQRAIANIKDFDFNARALYEAGLNHSRFNELFGMSAKKFLGNIAAAA